MEKIAEKFNPLVSIIIPVYNGANYMQEAIDSALAQTYKNIEVVVVNDGSTDDTEKISKSYGDKIRYFFKENGGVATALNLAIKNAKGDYISWLSHDDEYYPDKIEKQIGFMRDNDLSRKEILYSNYYREDLITNNSHENVMHPYLKYECSKWFSLKLLFKADLHGCSLLIPRECFEKVGYFDEKLKTTQDYDLWFKFVDHGYYFRHIDLTLISTRSHSKQGTINKIDLCRKEVIELYIKEIELFKQEINNQNYQEYQELVGYIEEKGLIDLTKYMEQNKNDYLKLNNIQAEDKDFKPMVSIVIPVFNGSNYLKEAVDSALAQTYKNVETIVVNDGSTDNTEEIAKSYRDRIRYFSKKNGGTSTALNVGIKNMKGQYFSWLSHDDMYYPDKIAKQIEELGKLKDKNTIMMSDLDSINEKYEKIDTTNYSKHINQYSPREKSYIYPIIYNQTHGCTLLIPKVCFDEVGLFDEKQLVAQDFEFFYRAFLKFPHKLVPEVLVTARDSSSRQGRRSKVLGSSEYSDLFITIIENLSDADMKLLAPDKLSFYHDMQAFFSFAKYNKALEYINKKIIKNLQISSLDLIGNKFNGFDLHLQLRENAIDSKQLVFYKESDDANTYAYNFDTKNATKELLQKKIFFDTDLVHLHLIHNIIDLNYLPIITRLKPTVLSLHDPFFLGGHCVHHFDCKKWKTHCKDCPYLHKEFVLNEDISALNFELKKQAIQNSQISAIVASQWMKNKVEQSPIWQGKKIYLLPLGIDQQLFKPVHIKLAKKKLNIQENSIVIMFRSDPGSFKGLDIIRKTLLGLKKSKNITLITVGQKGLLEDFKGKFNMLEYDWIKDDKLLASLYQACDIFLMPSRQEAFGMMAIEAMSCGKMVLALDCNGSALSDVIISPTCGLAVVEENFSKELQRLINNPEEVVERGKKSLDYAQKNYSKDVFVKEMINIYEEIMSNHHLDKSSELILQQLKTHAVLEAKNNPMRTAHFKFLTKKLSPLRQFLLSFFIKYKEIFPKKLRTTIREKLIRIEARLKFLK